MSYAFDGNTTDTYQEFICPHSDRVTAQISNNPVSIGFGVGGDGRKGTAIYPAADEVLLPSFAGLDRTCDAIRIKSYTLGKPANVKMSAGGGDG